MKKHLEPLLISMVKILNGMFIIYFMTVISKENSFQFIDGKF